MSATTTSGDESIEHATRAVVAGLRHANALRARIPVAVQRSLVLLAVILSLLCVLRATMTDPDYYLADAEGSRGGAGGGSASRKWSVLFQDDEGARMDDAEDAAAQEVALRAKMLDFFKVHNPAKLKTVDAIVDKYLNNLPGLNEQLRKKYNADLSSMPETTTARETPKSPPSNQNEDDDDDQPPPQFHQEESGNGNRRGTSFIKDQETRLKEQLRVFFETYNKKKLASVDEVYAMYGHRISALNAKLRERYGADLTSLAAPSQLSDEERRVVDFFATFRPGESLAWVRRMMELYGDSLEDKLRREYGADLSKTPVGVNQDELQRRLVAFFGRFNPGKLATAKDAARKYASNVHELNARLRSKYGMDLNGKRANQTTREMDLARIAFVEGELRRPRNAFVRSLWEKELLNDDDDSHLAFKRGSRSVKPVHPKKSSSSSSSSVLLDSAPSAVGLVCFGLPHTGGEALMRQLARALGMRDPPTEDETLQRLEAALDGSTGMDPKFNVFDDHNLVMGLAPTYYFQEMMAAYPKAVVVIFVRDVDAWWADVVKQSPFFAQDVACENGGGGGGQRSKRLCALRDRAFRMVFGSPAIATGASTTHEPPVEYLWKSAYEDFYDRLLSSSGPSDRRILLHAHHERASLTLDRLFAQLAIDREKPKWSLPRLDPHVSRTVDVMAHLHQIPPRSQPAKHSKTKVVLLGMDASGVDRVASALRMAGLSGVMSTHDWETRLLSGKGCGEMACHDVAAMKEFIAGGIGGFPLLSRVGEVLGGTPVGSFLRELAAQVANEAQFVLVVKPLAKWLSDARCLLRALSSAAASSSSGSSVADKMKRSLLRAGRDDTNQQILSLPLVQYAYQREFGFALHEYSDMTVADHALKRRYQDFVDRVARIIPPNRLLVLDPDTLGAREQLRSFLKLTYSGEENDDEFPSSQQLANCE